MDNMHVSPAIWISLLLVDAAFGAVTPPPTHAPVQDAAQVQDQDDDLADRLLRKSAGEEDEDVMDRIMRLMAEAGRRLELGFDPGDETQAVQARILKELDDAINEAASRQRRRQSSQPPPQGDTRKQQDPSKPKPQPSDKQQGEDAAMQAGNPSEAAPAGTGVAEGAALDGTLIDRRRGWGHLPQRDRDQILQSFGERMLERYQSWIERYYRALQSDDDALSQP